MSEYKDPRESLKNKITSYLEDIWPSIYRWINDFFFGVINFLKELVSALWR